MARELHDAIIRRTDGSIDIDFYARRSAHLRREAFAATPGIVAQWLRAVFLGAGRLVRRSLRARRTAGALTKPVAGR
ncbi:hypothetical protein DK26_11010 [Bosea sp. WAO]|nr:hypothetical protein DK26_11010 [Bosea sp. WAO]